MIQIFSFSLPQLLEFVLLFVIGLLLWWIISIIFCQFYIKKITQESSHKIHKISEIIKIGLTSFDKLILINSIAFAGNYIFFIFLVMFWWLYFIHIFTWLVLTKISKIRAFTINKIFLHATICFCLNLSLVIAFIAMILFLKLSSLLTN